MKKTLTTLTLAAALGTGLLFAEKGPVYISPNFDGIQDYLEVPLQIKERRYVSEWAFTIYNEKGAVVRTIGNKDPRPNRITFKSFFKSLVTAKTGVEIPSSVIWNGMLDDGSVAADGTYYYAFSATDDNGNSASTEKLCVIVDNTPPEVELTQPSQDNKIFGEGAKSLFTVKQDGSVEEKWIGTFSDSTGKVVRTYNWTKSAPLKFDWAGTDDNGSPLADGVYNYRITAQDQAGNVSAPAAITNIIYSAEKPATNITITGTRYFSPKVGSTNATMKFDVKIPVPDPSSGTGNKLVEWAVSIVGSDGKVLRSFKGTDNPPSTIEFDGMSDNKSVLSDGTYQALVTAKYLNGFEPDPVKSPAFMLDTVNPKAALSLSSKTFGSGDLSTLTIKQETASDNGSPIANWHGEIVDASGKAVWSQNFGSFPPETIVWNGLDSSNNFAADGTYNYVLSATDAAGNASVIKSLDFALDTRATEIMLSSSAVAFNPAGDKAHNTIRLTPVLRSGSAISKYTLTIADAKGKAVYSTSENHALPKDFAWNGLSSEGTRCADGIYTATLSTVSANGSEAKASAQPFTIDSVVPSIEVSVPYTLFSPEASSAKAVLPVTAKSSSEDKWTALVQNAKGQTVKTYEWQGVVPSFGWDGTDDSGNKVSDGAYKLVFTSEDLAGNKASAEIKDITVDSREVKAYVTTEEDAFSPNGDGKFDTQKFTVRTTVSDGIENWKFDITSAEGKVVRSWSSVESKNLPSAITWDGLDGEGKVSEGIFTGNLSIVYAKGNKVSVSSSAFICTVTAPQLSVKTAPKYFSPDNDGTDDDLYIQLKGNSMVPLKNWSFQIKDPNNGHKFWGTSGKSAITERIIWDGRSNNGELVQSAMDYPYEFTVTDTLGMTSTVEGKISVDVLVIRVGDVLKMAVPSIIFRSDNADFELESKVGKGGLTDEQLANNERVLKRIAEILKKFKEYTVTIEGHANNVSGTEEEETSTANGNIPLEPLSQKRAEFVKSKLKSYGVDAGRLSAIGRGGRQPVVARSDKDNWWKNRRVEFILNK